MSDDGYDSDDFSFESEHPKGKLLRECGVEIKQPSSSSSLGEGDDLFGTEETGSGEQFMAVKPWKGAIFAPSKPLTNNPELPAEELKIHYVHGYRGFDSRNNICINAKGHIVYPVAGVVVVYDPRTRTQRHYLGQDDDVLCLAQHPTNLNIVATGQNATISHIDRRGKPPHICVWDSTDFQKTWIIKLDQADRAVRSVGFSVCGKYLAAVMNDDNHSVKIWEWETKKLVGSAKGDANEIFLLKWNHKISNEFVTVGKKHCTIWSFENGKLTGKKADFGNNPVQTFYSVAFSEKGYTCVGTMDGSIYVFVNGKVAKVFKGVHNGKVLTIDWWPQGLITGGSDGQVKILNSKLELVKSFNFTNKVVAVYMLEQRLIIGTMDSQLFYLDDWHNSAADQSELTPITSGHWDGELWAVGFNPNDSDIYCTAGEDNLIAVWSLSRRKMLRKNILSDKTAPMPKIRKAATDSSHPPNQCARSVSYSPDGQHIAVGCNSGEVIVYEAETLDKLTTINLNNYGKRKIENQTQNWIQEMKYSPSGKTLAVGTHGSVICLLSVQDGYKCKGTLKAHNSFITHLDWSEDSTCMRSVCGAYELLFHNIDEDDLKSSSQNPSAKQYRDTKWATTTVTFGWEVDGIYEPDQTGSDINGVDVDANKQLIATGDDFGNVNLYRYPCNKVGNQFRVYEGHSSHVPCVRFSPDGRYIVSTGGHDKAIFQWSIN